MLLRTLSPSDEAAFQKARLASDPSFAFGLVQGMTFLQYLDHLDAAERGIDLPPNHVPSTMYFGFMAGELVGRLMLRHRLNDVLLKRGGNIGYVVIPEHRNRGVATQM